MLENPYTIYLNTLDIYYKSIIKYPIIFLRFYLGIYDI